MTTPTKAQIERTRAIADRVVPKGSTMSKWLTAYDAALAAIIETQEACARIAETAPINLPGVAVGLADGASIAANAIAAAIRDGGYREGA